jgi:mRNA interferase MazF
MPKDRRGELWMADVGFVAKVRPVLILSVDYRNDERAVVTCVLRTTSVRGTQYEVPNNVYLFGFSIFNQQRKGSPPCKSSKISIW